MIKINIISNNKNWKNYLKNPSSYIQNKIFYLNKKYKKYDKNIIFCTLLLSGDAQIKKLNKKFRNKNNTTDVLSFPFYKKKDLKNKLKKEKEVYLGDVIINLNQIKSRNNKAIFRLEFDKLWVHGLVHLFGYDHKKNKDFYTMSRVEKKFLSYLG
tara:strand:+ start:3116 stop:3580 length:465 start_codon:yes stop_codon:yes gene_type:complete